MRVWANGVWLSVRTFERSYDVEPSLNLQSKASARAPTSSLEAARAGVEAAKQMPCQVASAAATTTWIRLLLDMVLVGLAALGRQLVDGWTEASRGSRAASSSESVARVLDRVASPPARPARRSDRLAALDEDGAACQAFEAVRMRGRLKQRCVERTRPPHPSSESPSSDGRDQAAPILS